MVVRATFTPFDTMLPAALTRLIAEAFCSADPARMTLSFLVAVSVDPSTTTFSPAADAIFTAPWVELIVWLVSTSWLELAFEAVVARDSTSLAALLVVESTLCIVAEFRAEFELLLLALFDADAL